MSQIPNISMWKHARETKNPWHIPIVDFYRDVKEGKYATEAQRVQSNLENKQEVKKRIYAATLSGTFSERTDAALLQHSHRIAVDIDPDGNPDITDMKALRDTLGTWKEVEFSSLSVSGKGVFCTVVIENPNEHRGHWLALEQVFKGFGIVIDRSCKNVSRARYVSYDPEAVINENVEPFRSVYMPPQVPAPAFNGSPSTAWIDKWIRVKQGLSFIKGERHEYIVQFVGAANRTAVPEHEVRSALRGYEQEDFPQREIEDIIRSMYSKPNWGG